MSKHPLDLRLILWLTDHIHLVGIVCILLSVITWGIDLMGWVHHCPYCRTSRTAIGLIGIIMLVFKQAPILFKYLAVVIGVFGLTVADEQLFLVVKEINAGEPFGSLNMILSAMAICVLVAQLFIIFACHRRMRNLKL